MKLKEGFTLREVAGQKVVIPSGSDLDLNMMITLNETGCILWKMLETGAELPELTNALVEEFGIDAKMAEEHAAKFVEKLKTNEFLAE